MSNPCPCWRALAAVIESHDGHCCFNARVLDCHEDVLREVKRREPGWGAMGSDDRLAALTRVIDDMHQAEEAGGDLRDAFGTSPLPGLGCE